MLTLDHRDIHIQSPYHHLLRLLQNQEHAREGQISRYQPQSHSQTIYPNSIEVNVNTRRYLSRKVDAGGIQF